MNAPAKTIILCEGKHDSIFIEEVLAKNGINIDDIDRILLEDLKKMIRDSWQSQSAGKIHQKILKKLRRKNIPAETNKIREFLTHSRKTILIKAEGSKHSAIDVIYNTALQLMNKNIRTYCLLDWDGGTTYDALHRKISRTRHPKLKIEICQEDCPYKIGVLTTEESDTKITLIFIVDSLENMIKNATGIQIDTLSSNESGIRATISKALSHADVRKICALLNPL